MPYKIRGKTVIKKDTGKVVGHSENPKEYLRTLQAIEHGWKPTGKKAKHHSANDGSFHDKLKKRFGV